VDSIDLSPLEPILAEIRSQDGVYGVNVSVDDVRYHFEKGAQLLHPAVSRSCGEQVGLQRPEILIGYRTRIEREGVRWRLER